MTAQQASVRWRERIPLRAKWASDLRSLELRCAAKGRAYLTPLFYRGECSNLSFFFNLFFWTLVTAARVANVASTLLLPMLARAELRGELPPHRSRGLFVRRAPLADEQAWTQKEAR